MCVFISILIFDNPSFVCPRKQYHFLIKSHTNRMHTTNNNGTQPGKLHFFPIEKKKLAEHSLRVCSICNKKRKLELLCASGISQLHLNTPITGGRAIPPHLSFRSLLVGDTGIEQHNQLYACVITYEQRI